MTPHISRIPIEQKNGATLFVFGDRQEGSPSYVQEAWEAFKKEFQRTPNAWALGLGDYGDWLRPSMRTKIGGALSGDDSARQMVDDQVKGSVEKIIDNMNFLRGKLIGLHEGHHNWKYLSGENTDQHIARALKAPYLGWMAATRLILEKYKTSNHAYTIISTHGNSSAKGVPAAASAMLRNLTTAWIADHYIEGHGCKSASFSPFERGFVRRKGPAGIERKIVRCLLVGGFARAFTNGWQSDYVERAGLTPQPMSWGVIRFRLTRAAGDIEYAGRIPKPQPENSSDVVSVEQTNHYFEDA